MSINDLPGWSGLPKVVPSVSIIPALHQIEPATGESHANVKVWQDDHTTWCLDFTHRVHHLNLSKTVCLEGPAWRHETWLLVGSSLC